MILQSLVQYYDSLAQKGEIAQEGWSTSNVSYSMEIDENGKILGFTSLMNRSEDLKKELPQVLTVPEQVKRTSGIAGNFLCDNAQYILGMSTKKGGDVSKQRKQATLCFQESARLHHKILDGLDSAPAKAVLRFYDTWNPENAYDDPLITEKSVYDILMKGGNIVFEYRGQYLFEYEEIRQAWECYHDQGTQGEPQARCLVTGRMAPIEIVHPSIKNIAGAQSSGAALVSYNAPAFCSFNREQGMNAPVSKAAAFKYGTALNYLTARKENTQRIADTTVVFWSRAAKHQEENIFQTCLVSQSYLTDPALKERIKEIAAGKHVVFQEEDIDPEDDFCILGLAPNAGRISVRFFLQKTFGTMLRNLERHYQRLEIIKPTFAVNSSLGIWSLLNETANQKAREKVPPAPMAGAVLM